MEHKAKLILTLAMGLAIHSHLVVRDEQLGGQNVFIQKAGYIAMVLLCLLTTMTAHFTSSGAEGFPLLLVRKVSLL